MSDLPKFVEFHEEGPREGFQSEKQLYSLAERAAVIDALSLSGLSQIQVASFVNPKMVPAMADADQLFSAIKRRDGVRYTALWLNERGFERAAATPGVDLDGKLMFYTTDKFSQANNNCSAADLAERQRGWMTLYDQRGVATEQAYIMTAFGCYFEGEVAIDKVLHYVAFIRDMCAEEGRALPAIYLADTVGWANPGEIKRRIGALREMLPEARIGLHLHDTRGLGAANFYAALEMGVDLFDASVAGLGGCPFTSHADMQAAGNICTEDMVFMCHELGIETGIDLEALIEAARVAEQTIGRPLMGKCMHSGSLAGARAA
ncbi:MAG: hydroxymethylglutaryl-CoA lyase [Alphaproteobacteria bacterium]|jgi:isopropylmalate/homocitrate/citramalate synthase|nr:hydroxymethylglutaryl-CoA lyase [Alphaproteobacteria bacterium]HJP20911.1 hydroxymethylglutaryl-CoA lyase [Alphaproteobacteria bacterium]